MMTIKSATEEFSSLDADVRKFMVAAAESRRRVTFLPPAEDVS
jgi:hypothetical protein